MWRSHDGGRAFKAGMLLGRSLDGAPADGSDAVALFDNLGHSSPAFLALRWGKSNWQTRIMLDARTVIRARYGPPMPTLGNIYGPRKWYESLGRL
jgi:hypothetical protein